MFHTIWMTLVRPPNGRTACVALDGPTDERASRKLEPHHRLPSDRAATEAKILGREGGTARSPVRWPRSENPVLYSRRANRIDLRLHKDDKATGDEDIIRRHWLPVDIDPKRPSGISSSEEEHEESLQKAERIRGFLTEMGWPAPICADSGNGAHLLYQIDLPSDSASTELIKQALSVISAFFSDERSEIDTSVSNAARLWKLYGCLPECNRFYNELCLNA